MNRANSHNTKGEYKIIEYNLNRTPYKEELIIIEKLNEIFPKNDFFFDIKDYKVVLYLHSLDLNKFRKHIDKLINQYGLNKKYPNPDDNPFLSFIKKIQGIKSYGIKSGKRIYVGYYKERKVKNRKNKVAARGSCFYTKDNNFTKEINDLPDEFINKIICGDSENILKKLPNNCIDLVLTSPPYNFGLGYDATEDGIDWNRYFEKLFAIFEECIRVVKYGGRIIINVQPLFSDYIPIHHIISNFFMEKKLIWKGEILWEKHNYNCKYTAWGSWKSPSNPYLKYTWEFLEVFCKGDLKKPGLKDNIDITGDEFKKWVYAKWEIAPERNMRKYDHPAMFPEKLVERSLKLFSYKNDIVLDPFNGVGSTTLVAKKLDRRFLGIDISDRYCKIAENRLKGILG